MRTLASQLRSNMTMASTASGRARTVSRRCRRALAIASRARLLSVAAVTSKSAASYCLRACARQQDHTIVDWHALTNCTTHMVHDCLQEIWTAAGLGPSATCLTDFIREPVPRCHMTPVACHSADCYCTQRSAALGTCCRLTMKYCCRKLAAAGFIVGWCMHAASAMWRCMHLPRDAIC